MISDVNRRLQNETSPLLNCWQFARSPAWATTLHTVDCWSVHKIVCFRTKINGCWRTCRSSSPQLPPSPHGLFQACKFHRFSIYFLYIIPTCNIAHSIPINDDFINSIHSIIISNRRQWNSPPRQNPSQQNKTKIVFAVHTMDTFAPHSCQPVSEWVCARFYQVSQVQSPNNF